MSRAGLEARKEEDMTKKMNWRLPELPTGDEVASLVEQGVITTQEARDIILKSSEEKDTETQVKALQEQVEFLQGLVDKLASKSPTWTYTYANKIPTTYWYNSGYSPVLSQVSQTDSNSAGTLSISSSSIVS